VCGIFGFAASVEQPSTMVIEGLRELEYRGYDSWGVAVACNGGVLAEKEVGKIGEARTALPWAKSGLGHTRWATHGGVTRANAHPHFDCAGRFAIIHNGIVENHVAIRQQLQPSHVFSSETDTEVVAHLLEEELARTPAGPYQLVQALMATFRALEGLSAIAVLDAQSGHIAAAKNGSPLVLGWGDGASYLASDAVALLPYTQRLTFLEDGQAALLGSGHIRLFDIASGAEIEPEVRFVSWNVHQTSLGIFNHYMEKEINEQPGVLRHLAAHKQPEVDALATMIRRARRVFVVGCGTANHAGLAGQYLLARIAGCQVTPLLASEVLLIEPFIDEETLILALSQSGETIDVLDAVRLGKAHGARIAALTNVEGSSLSRLADLPILLDCGPEKCVLATKSYTAKLALLLMTAWTLAGDPEQGRRTVGEGALLLDALLEAERAHGRLDELAARIQTADHVFILGRRTNYPLALEAALKIKEVSYIHAEGFASGELKHGVIALIEPGTPCLLFATEPEVLQETLAGAAEVRARGAYTIGFSQEAHPEFESHISIYGHGEATIFEVAGAFQTLAYRLALCRGCDPDKPRNLAKSVTVR
jgi:glucosamine--fructose-6-phosphate aminotransferase (isomerizing)